MRYPSTSVAGLSKLGSITGTGVGVSVPSSDKNTGINDMMFVDAPGQFPTQKIIGVADAVKDRRKPNANTENRARFVVRMRVDCLILGRVTYRFCCHHHG